MDGKEEILDLLKDNARLSAADIAAMTKKTEAEVEAIIKEFEANGTIMKYAAIVNPEKTGDGAEKIQAEIEVQVNPERDNGYDGIAERIYRFPQVKSLYLMSADSYSLKVIVEEDSLKELFNFVARKIATLEGVHRTRTHLVMKIYKENDIVYVQDENDRREKYSE